MLLRLALAGLIISLTNAERFPIEINQFDTTAELTPRQDVDESYRLPTETVPTHYTIDLWTSVHDGEPDFRGRVKIDLKVVATTETIVVHNRGLTITSVLLRRVEEDLLVDVEEPTWSPDEQRDLLTFQCTSSLELGDYQLYIAYTGRLQTSSSSGFFRKLYRDENNVRRYIASTQFEPTHARMAFPCYDEPSLKATFAVSITHHSSYNAVSNMPPDGEPEPDIENPDFVTTHFVTTQIMSTYLLAFAVTNFETRELTNQQIHARPNAIEQTEFALQVGVDVLYAMNVHTDISYYNYKPKLAQIAVPDWGSGAMENWGLVTYGEPVLLFDPAVNTYRNKIDIVTIIAHEYAHQWFGNLVTTDWWQYIWLNEGFATMYGYLGAELAYPEDNYLQLFQIHYIHPTLRSDSSDSTRPMNWNAATPAEISALFDGVAYGKAGSVLNMFRVILGENSWRAGLKKYLLSREWAAATPDDLYAGLQAAISSESALPADSTVKEVMETWTTAAGYPVLNVRRSYQSKDVIISQERFYADKVLPNEHVWYIPYNVANERDGDFELNTFDWLTTKSGKVTIDVEPEEWLIFNRQQFGFYRVNYDTRNWQLLTDALVASPASFHHQNRAQLIDDAFYLARADLLDFGVVLEMMFALRNDYAYLPWAAGNNVLTYLYNKLRGTEHYIPFVFYVNELIGEIYQTLELVTVDENESLEAKYLKQTISTWACKIGMSDCLSRTKETFQEAVRGNLVVHPDVSTVVYCYGAQSASDEEFKWLYQRMFESKNPAERTLLIDAMGCSEQNNQLEAFLTTSIGSGVGVEVNYYDSERNRVVQAVYSASRTGVDALIDFLNDWDMADDFIYWLEQPVFNNAIAAIASRSNTPDELVRLEELFVTVQSLAPTAVVEAALATVQANFDWHDSLEGLIVAEFFENYFNENEKVIIVHYPVMIVKTVAICILLALAAADRPQWRKVDGDLAPEPEIELFQAVDETYKLPTVSVPTHYNLFLKTAIHENNRVFKGTVEIFLTLMEPSDTITVHNRQLSIWKVNSYTVSAEGRVVFLVIPTFKTDPTTEHLTLTFGGELPVGNYMIEIEFQGQLQNNNNMGFFASSYVDNDGKRNYVASTKFEPTHARSAFPCYDEPKLKATFALQITHFRDYEAISNMPANNIVREDPDDPNYVITVFPTSKKMSTYLLAFAVTNFARRSNGISSVYARPNVYEETEYPLQTGVDILSALSDYTGVLYTNYMPKMAQIAIPDRGSGAMENWGLVAYGEPVLLFNPAINTYRNKKSVTTIIAHEFAHQWFGNLVSPDWWDHIWLNEGFATVYEYLAAQLAYPEDNYWDFWNVEVIHNAFSADARESVRPMTWNAATPSEIAALFDTVAYDKAGSVLNMFRVVFQDDNWREGLLVYLLNRELDTAVADDLSAALQQVLNGKNILPADLTVKQAMDSWTTEPGFPILNVRRDYKNGQLYISQERFYSDRRLPGDHVYHIPYNYAIQSKPDFTALTFDWLSSTTAKLTTDAAANEWVIFNKQQTSYYRVNYDSENWKLIINSLLQDPSTIHVQNRAQLINDAYNLARADRIDMAVALELMTYLKKEYAYPPWAAAGTVLTYFNNKLRGTEQYSKFIAYVQELVLPIYVNLPVDSVSENETLLGKYLRQIITTWACRIGHEDCLVRMKAALERAVQSNTPVHPDIANVVYCYGLHETAGTEFVWLYEKMLASKNQAERALLIDSLACSQNKEHLKDFLMTSIGSGATFNYLETERTRIISSVYSASRVGVDALIDFLSNDNIIDEIISRLGKSVVENAVVNIASRTNNNEELALLNDLLKKLENKISSSTIASVASIHFNNVGWFNSLEGLIAEEFFEKYTSI
ncbi:uncharacterized protein LOC129732954 [Wyeomyia smithii]|uniref:uncharacterized protein LOC129732954 n=1 Tax=Wyeomyia smithii TaxID=174621 RepID=UPI002467ED37|nr:uncharacterized protein LOC129732954 [Wyeomyia smithii]